MNQILHEHFSSFFSCFFVTSTTPSKSSESSITSKIFFQILPVFFHPLTILWLCRQKLFNDWLEKVPEIRFCFFITRFFFFLWRFTLERLWFCSFTFCWRNISKKHFFFRNFNRTLRRYHLRFDHLILINYLRWIWLRWLNENLHILFRFQSLQILITTNCDKITILIFIE